MKKYTYRPILSEEQIAQFNRRRAWVERIVGSLVFVGGLLMAWIKYSGLDTNLVYVVATLFVLLPLSVGAIIEENKLNCKPVSVDELKMLLNWSNVIIDGRDATQDLYSELQARLRNVNEDAGGKKASTRRAMPRLVADEVGARVNAILSTRKFIAKYEFEEIQQRVLSLPGRVTGENPGVLKPNEALSPKIQAILVKFPKTGSLWLLFTSVVFLGINLFVWTFSRAKVLNAHSLKPVSLRLVFLGLSLYVAGFVQAYLITQTIVLHPGLSPSALEALAVQLAHMLLVLIGLVMGGLVCLGVWLFIFRARLHTLLGVSPVIATNVPRKRWWLWSRDPRWIDGSFLFCFSVFYLNYKMNRIRQSLPR